MVELITNRTSSYDDDNTGLNVNLSCDEENVVINEPPGNFVISDCATVLPVVGSLISEYWPLENQYYIRTLNAINDGKHIYMYDDDDVETLNLDSDTWK